MMLSDEQTFAIAAPITAAIYWRHAFWRLIVRLWRRRSERQTTGAQPAPLPIPELAADVLTPLGFERHCAAVLRSQGWHATLTAGSTDQGIDVLAKRDGISVVIQCKLYSRPIGNGAVQEAIAGREYMGATYAAVVSNQGYTPAARDLAARTRVLLLSVGDLKRSASLFK